MNSIQKEVKPTVFVIEDDPYLREAMQWLFDSVHLPVEAYPSAVEFLEKYQPNRSGVILTDVRMPNMSGLQLLDELKLRKNRLPVIVITGHGDIPMAVRAMKAGALDFILKPYHAQMVLEQVQRAIADYSQNTTETDKESVHECITSLTLREKQVMELIVAGKLNKQIADELSIAISTVEAHRARVMKKMKVKTLAQLIKVGISVC